MLLVVLTLPFHAFLGRHDHGGGGHHRRRRTTPTCTTARWAPGCPTPIDDQHLAGGILWGSGDLIALVLFGVLFVQWVRQSMQEAKREDRRLDLLEARERAASARAADGDR